MDSGLLLEGAVRPVGMFWALFHYLAVRQQFPDNAH